jgi:arylformamidase
MPRFIDITRALRNDIAVWPGDRTFNLERLSRRVDHQGTNQGANVGGISMCLHNGTHADAFFHYDNDGATIDQLDPGIFVGPCVVIDVRGRNPIGVASVENQLGRLGLDLRAHPRLLLKTDFWQDDTTFPEDFPGIDPPLASWLADRGVVLIGTDVPSVDAMTTPAMPAHLDLGLAKITILESLHLTHVAPGPYELIALPLKIAGADGSPVRAVLVEA